MSFHGIETQGQDVAQPDTNEAKYNGEHDVRGRTEPLAVLRQAKSLKAERGESRVAAADAQHEELAERRGGQPAALGSRSGSEYADDEATGNVDYDGAPRKLLTNGMGQAAGEPPACQAANTATNEDPKRVQHLELRGVSMTRKQWASNTI